MPASGSLDLLTLRQRAYQLAAELQALHEQVLAEVGPGSSGQYEWHLRRAKHKALATAHAVHDAQRAAEAELAPMGEVRRRGPSPAGLLAEVRRA
jgi:hypothetical protein